MLIDMIRIVCQPAFDKYISLYPINYDVYGMISVDTTNIFTNTITQFLSDLTQL